MKGYKVYTILIIIVLVLIAFFTTKIILENNYSNEYDEILNNSSWSITKTEIHAGEETITVDEVGISFMFDNKKLKICNNDICNDTTYILKDNELEIKEYTEEGFNGIYIIEYVNDTLILKQINGNNYTKYYLTKPMG